MRNCEGNSDRNTLATGYSWLTIIGSKSCQKSGKLGMTSRLEAYRVSAYNTAKLSENKMHDDTVAKRFGFSGRLVPGVDVMAYMMHLPVKKWGRAFLERGLIEARFIKPVYDGEIANVSGEESDGILSIEVESRGQLCTTGSASLPAAGKSGDELTARAKVTGNYEKKGHRFVELDALVVANGRTPLAHCQHIAIYQPREQAAA